MNCVNILTTLINEIYSLDEELTNQDLNYIRNSYSGFYDLEKKQFHPLGEHPFHSALMSTLDPGFRSGDIHILKLDADVAPSSARRHEDILIKYRHSHLPSEKEKEATDNFLRGVKDKIHREFRHHKVLSQRLHY